MKIMDRTIQILGIGDIHLKLDVLNYIILSALNSGEHYDLIICSGDFAGDIISNNKIPSSEEQLLYNYGLKAIFDSLSIFGVPVLFVPGNHDQPDITGSGMCQSVDILSGLKPYRFNGINFIGIGGSPLTPGSFPYEWTEEEAKKKLNGKKIAGSDNIWILHSPPFGNKTDIGGINGEHIGSLTIREMIERYQPTLCFCGHIHEGIGVEKIRNSTVINLGSIFDLTPLTLDGKIFSAPVNTYFSIVIHPKSTVTVCAFMHSPSMPVQIEPLMWHCDGEKIKKIKAPKSLFQDKYK